MDLEIFYGNWEPWEVCELVCAELKRAPGETSYWAPVITWALKIQRIGLYLPRLRLPLLLSFTAGSRDFSRKVIKL